MFFWWHQQRLPPGRCVEVAEMDLDSADIAETIALKAVSLTHVRYHKGDLLGHALSWFSLLPVFIALGGFVSHFIFRRELQAMFFALGLCVNEVINQIIKELAHEARPLTCEALEMCDSNGWPSSHSQYMCFFSMYWTLLATRRLQFADEFRRTFVAFLPWPFALTVMYSRVYLGYHTTPQIVAGGSLGLLFGAGWFFLMDIWVADWFPWLEDTRVCRYLRVKDSSHIPDVIGFEYNTSKEARQRAAANSSTSSEKVAQD